MAVTTFLLNKTAVKSEKDKTIFCSIKSGLFFVRLRYKYSLHPGEVVAVAPLLCTLIALGKLSTSVPLSFS